MTCKVGTLVTSGARSEEVLAGGTGGGACERRWECGCEDWVEWE